MYPVAEAVEDPAKMLVNELTGGLAAVDDWLKVGDDRPLQVRPDFGIGLVASVFGATVEVAGNNPPWVHPLSSEDVETHIEDALEALEVDRAHETGWLPRVWRTLDYYATVFGDYPRASSSIAIALPDLQGPFDTAEMLWGSDIFLGLMTEPVLVDRLLGAIGATMVHLHDCLRQRIGQQLLPDGFSHQHGSVVRGNLLLRCDSNLMMNPQMHASQVFVHDRNVLKAVGGGGYHSCGCWQRNIPTIISADEVGTLDFGTNQSQMNDMDEIYQLAHHHEKHLNLITATVDELRTGTIRKRFPTGVTLHCLVDDIGSARELMTDYASQ